MSLDDAAVKSGQPVGMNVIDPRENRNLRLECIREARMFLTALPPKISPEGRVIPYNGADLIRIGAGIYNYVTNEVRPQL